MSYKFYETLGRWSKYTHYVTLHIAETIDMDRRLFESFFLILSVGMLGESSYRNKKYTVEKADGTFILYRAHSIITTDLLGNKLQTIHKVSCTIYHKM